MSVSRALKSLEDLHNPDYKDGFCPQCGEALELETCSEGDDADGNRGWQREEWLCPGCGEVE